jgi:hypothetical protein
MQLRENQGGGISMCCNFCMERAKTAVAGTMRQTVPLPQLGWRNVCF